MPQGDRTGPTGQGPRTGRALGFCFGFDTPGYSKGFGNGMGRGFGVGGGRGRGIGFGRGRHMNWSNPGFYQGYPWPPSMSKEEEIRLLKAQAESLKRTQKELEKRLTELEKGSDQ